MKDALKGFAVIFLIFMAFSLPLTMSAAPAPQIPWHLYAALLDASTGEVLTQAQMYNEDRTPMIFKTPGECVARAVAVGPVPKHDGVAVVLRCVRADNLPDGKPQLTI